MQIAATEGIDASPGLGRMPLAQSAATLPGVSEPSSVVRSMQRMARSSAQSLDAFLIERLASDAARSSAPTWSTLRTPRISDPRWDRERAVAATTQIVGGAPWDARSGHAQRTFGAKRGLRWPRIRTYGAIRAHRLPVW